MRDERKFKPHCYQKKTIKFFVSRAAAGAFLDPGLGKTMISYSAFDVLKTAKMVRGLLVVTLLRPAYKVWPSEISKWKLPFKCIVLHGKTKTLESLQTKADVWVINYEGLDWLLGQIQSWPKKKLLPFDMLVFDECFVAGTKISALKGQENIENLKAGDLVLTSNGYKKVLSLHKGKNQFLINVSTSSGAVIRATPNHPFFTNRGWVCAGNLNRGDVLYDPQKTLRLVQKEVSNLESEAKVLQSFLRNDQNDGTTENRIKDSCNEIQKEGVCIQELPAVQKRIFNVSTQEEILQCILRFEMESSTTRNTGEDLYKGGSGQNQRSVARQKKQLSSMEQGSTLVNEAPQSDEPRCQDQRANMESSWGKWATNSETCATFADCIEPAMENRTRHFIRPEAARLSNLLQSRFGSDQTKISNRSGWGQPQFSEKERARSEKDNCVEEIRVESIAHQELRNPCDVYTLEIEGCPHFFADGVLVHNSSKLRNTNTQRFKIVRELLGYFKRRYILTGTPAPKGLMGLFGQIFALDGGTRLGRYITHFRMKYCDKVQIGVDGPMIYNIRPGVEPEIYKKIEDVVIRFGEEELDNIPKLVVREIRVELPRKARAVYDDLKRDLITAIDNRVIVAKNAGVATQKLRQVANGGLYFDEAAKRGYDREWSLLHNEKTEAVLELVDELQSHPVLIGYEFHHDLARLRAALPKGTPCLTDVNMKEYEFLERDWNRGNIPIALAQINSISHGNNLQGSGAAIIVHSFIWNYEDYDQFIKRIKRQGNKAKRAYVYRIVADRTVDEPILMSYETKGATQNDLFNALKRSLKE